MTSCGHGMAYCQKSNIPGGKLPSSWCSQRSPEEARAPCTHARRQTEIPAQPTRGSYGASHMPPHLSTLGPFLLPGSQPDPLKVTGKPILFNSNLKKDFSLGPYGLLCLWSKPQPSPLGSSQSHGIHLVVHGAKILFLYWKAGHFPGGSRRHAWKPANTKSSLPEVRTVPQAVCSMLLYFHNSGREILLLCTIL